MSFMCGENSTNTAGLGLAHLCVEADTAASNCLLSRYASSSSKCLPVMLKSSIMTHAIARHSGQECSGKSSVERRETDVIVQSRTSV
ncbi:hypothetical protein QQF64_027107 [Cirrhinus molitorella]|uniref:Uncharacterized protein n=1 Tax=Cirrhinus molitorella TaxID=172907 RepID=A0ABR3NBF6_9TELE